MTSLGSCPGRTSFKQWPPEKRSKAASRALVTPDDGGKVFRAGAAAGRSIRPVPDAGVGGGGAVSPARTIAMSIKADQEWSVGSDGSGERLRERWEALEPNRENTLPLDSLEEERAGGDWRLAR